MRVIKLEGIGFNESMGVSIYYVAGKQKEESLKVVPLEDVEDLLQELADDHDDTADDARDMRYQCKTVLRLLRKEPKP